MIKQLLTLLGLLAANTLLAQTNTLPTTGRVGIGTTSPQGTALNVVGTNTIGTEGNLSNAWALVGTPSMGIGIDGNEITQVGNHLYLAARSGNVVFRTGTTVRVTVVSNGNVGIGTDNPQAKLAVNGNILAKEVKVKTDISVPDYVFEPDYELPSLEEIGAYVRQHRHLPEIPSAADIERDGLDLAEMNLLLLKKVEELTLYLVEERKARTALEGRLAAVEAARDALEPQNHKIQKP